MRENVKLVSEKSPYYYTTTKNKRNTPTKLRLRKFDPVIGAYAWFQEERIKG